MLNDELELVFPTKEYKNQIEEYRKEFFDNGEKRIPGCAGLDKTENIDEWLKNIQNNLSEENITHKKVPSTVYLTIRKSDKKIVGNLQIRHRLNKSLLNYGGHIGDSVRPSERRKGYATEQIRLALKKCKELGIGNVLMDCDKTNIGSAKSIMNNGGIFENEIYVNGEFNQRFWISLKKRYADKYVNGKCKKCIYKIKYIKENDFQGDIVYYNFLDVTKKIIIPNGTSILDNNYKWLEFYDYNSKVKLTAIYDEYNKIIEWYFDIAKKIGKENNIPYEDDLYLDVVATPNGNIYLLDEDELENAFNRLEVNNSDFNIAYTEANKLINKLKNNTDKLKLFTDKYLNQMMGDDK